ncbi:MAG TPA: ATP-grasp domain-containing protein, partial [Saprospiraceae bacterium]|nr:ATP-grasp domain-containing protein [Saprospiraceae bacterium]
MKKRIGILGGGQLGKMLATAAANWHLDIWILDKSADFPAAPYCTKFVEGDFDDYDDVLNFGRQVDVLTVEIEHVNIRALFELQKEGKIIHPAPEKLEIIKDKALQKLFYLKNEIPASDFQLFDDEVAIKDAVQNGKLQLPFVQKSRTAGYDGRGVSVIKTSEDLLTNLLPGASVVEKLVDIDKELAVIVCRNERGKMSFFPPVEMVFNPVANLVEFLVCPAGIDLKTTE